MDVWLAKSDKPTPVLVSIHGGGFRGGNKSVGGGLLKDCLASELSARFIQASSGTARSGRDW